MDLVSRAEAFARDLHAGFARQGRSGRPVVAHLEEVVALLREAAENTLTANCRVSARVLGEPFGCKSRRGWPR